MQDEKLESSETFTEKKEPSGAVRSAETARVLVRRAKRAARRKFAAEEKVRIVLEGVRGELPFLDHHRTYLNVSRHEKNSILICNFALWNKGRRG